MAQRCRPDGVSQTTSTASGQNYCWTFSGECERPSTRLERFATWYWVRFVLGTSGERCLCKIGLGRLCLWLEDRAR